MFRREDVLAFTKLSISHIGSTYLIGKKEHIFSSFSKNKCSKHLWTMQLYLDTTFLNTFFKGRYWNSDEIFVQKYMQREWITPAFHILKAHFWQWKWTHFCLGKDKGTPLNHLNFDKSDQNLWIIYNFCSSFFILWIHEISIYYNLAHST